MGGGAGNTVQILYNCCKKKMKMYVDLVGTGCWRSRIFHTNIQVNVGQGVVNNTGLLDSIGDI